MTEKGDREQLSSSDDKKKKEEEENEHALYSLSSNFFTTGLIDDKGQILEPRMLPRHYPFDELALKRSGYVDSQCHHRTVSDLEKQRQQKITSDSTSGGVDGRVKLSTTTTSSDEPILPQNEEKLESKIASTKSKPVKMNIQGHLNIRQKNLGGQCIPKTMRITVGGNVKSHFSIEITETKKTIALSFESTTEVVT
uniref:Uncharacterized protein n=1 Tax=Romanomermis culicivorax TaxID=13658 RepID=A0A915KU70_ROMCU